MVDGSRKTYERNGVETIVDSDLILWLNAKHIEKGFDQKKLRVATVKHLSDHRKHRYKLLDEQKKVLASKVIMGCRTIFCRAIDCST